MPQSAAVRPDPSYQRKAAIANGGVVDHAGRVRVEPIRDFDLKGTIFETLEGAIPRFVMKTRIAKEVHWGNDAAADVQRRYDEARAKCELPPLDPALLDFLVDECDFDVEHADGSFLDHLYFGFEYCVQHFPQHSPIVMFLHSILGTGTNTFAMKAEKIPALRPFLTDFEWRHIEAFPSVLRLLYDGALMEELATNAHRPGAIRQIRMHRVIDNAPIAMSGEDLWIQLNYQLIHVIDFLPVANWGAHHSDNSFILFRRLFQMLDRAGKREAYVRYTPSAGGRDLNGERVELGGRLLTVVPDALVEAASRKSIRRFSERIGHSLAYTIDWA